SRSPPDDADDTDDGLDAFRDAEDEGGDLLGDEPTRGTSGDTEQVYRSAMGRLGKLEPDEELAGWETYLAKYPDSVYRQRIEARMEELTDLMYANVGPTTGPVDANKAEIGFSQALQLENIDPRSRVQLGFEMGLPSYLNLVADYEHQLARTLSFHGGIRRRYTGFNLEVGAHWSPVKSLRTNTLVTLLADVHLNTNPAYPGVRPQVAFGKRIGKVDLQLQGGPDITFRTWPDTAGQKVSGVQLAYTGGASVMYAASDKVGAFLESNLYMKQVEADGAFEGGLFRFNVVTFGLKFFPGKTANQEVNFGATVPYTQQWWQYHYGSIMAQYNRYLD
ncbi:MAG: hypothetical protein ABMA64_33345, partial [Myxococcota bacterium]